MRVNLNFNQPKNTIINPARVNASLAKHGSGSKGASRGRMSNDRLTLSPQGKLMSMIDNLTKQKQSIIERKNQLMETTLENGGKVEDIKDQLKNYNKQMSDIDKQISGLYAQQAKEAVEQDDRKKSGKSGAPKTEEAAQTQYLSSLANVSDSVKQAEMVSAVKDKVEGEIRVKETEVDMGGLHVDILVSKGGDGVTNVSDMIDNEMDALDRKEGEIAALRDKASELAGSQGEKIKDSMDDLEESKEQAVEDDEIKADMTEEKE